MPPATPINTRSAMTYVSPPNSSRFMPAGFHALSPATCRGELNFRPEIEPVLCEREPNRKPRARFRASDEAQLRRPVRRVRPIVKAAFKRPAADGEKGTGQDRPSLGSKKRVALVRSRSANRNPHVCAKVQRDGIKLGLPRDANHEANTRVSDANRLQRRELSNRLRRTKFEERHRQAGA